MSATSIQASDIVNILPGVISAGGNPLAMNGLALTLSTRVPIGTVVSFANQAAVASYFGGSSAEAAKATVYFAGYIGATQIPTAMLFAQYPSAAVAAYLRGGSVAALTLTQLQALSGTLILTVNGTGHTSTSISLSAATSFSNAATIIAAAFTTPPFAVSYDSVSGAFVFTDTTTGAASTISFSSGTLAAGLALTQATGATLSQGADAAVPGTFMAGILNITQNWVSFFTLFDPDAGEGNAVKLAFAEWENSTNNAFAYIAWDTDITPTESVPASTSLGFLISAANLSGTCLIYEPSDQSQAAFISGAIASINFNAKNGRITFAFKSQAGLLPGVTNEQVAHNLGGNPQAEGDFGNGYNFYGAYATRNQAFTFFNRGLISGKFRWLDSFVNQIWMNNSFQLSVMTFLTSIGSIPQNAAGAAMFRQVLSDDIQAAINFGAINSGVPLSSTQILEVNTAAGLNIAGTLASQGWYLQIGVNTPTGRASRTSPPATFWYTDGGSIQAFTMSSLEVQ